MSLFRFIANFILTLLAIGSLVDAASADGGLASGSLTFQEGSAVTFTDTSGTYTQGIYSGTQDTELRNGSGPLGNSGSINVDGYAREALTRFDRIFGTPAGEGPLERIPYGATITSATLTFSIFDTGSSPDMHRILGDWDEATATWDTFTLNGNTLGGIQDDDIEATFLRSFSGSSGTRVIDVTNDLQLWADGAPNYGWGFTPSGTNGVDWRSSEYGTLSARPLLSVDFEYNLPVAPEPGTWLLLATAMVLGAMARWRRRGAQS